ncbi:unnamed protein product, partial [Rotaria sordida]
VRGVNVVEEWSPAIRIEPLISEFELKGLQPDTNYMIRVRLFNEAGLGEQTISKKTSKSRIDPRSNFSNKRSNNRFPNKWVIIGIVSSIIAVLTITIILFIVIRSRYKCNRNHKNSSSLPPIPPRRNKDIEQSSLEAQEPLRNDGR